MEIEREEGEKREKEQSRFGGEKGENPYLKCSKR